MSIASLILGIIGIITAFTIIIAPLGFILVVVGLILGIVDVVKKGKTGGKKGIGIAGIVICAIMVVTLLIESVIVLISVGAYMNYTISSEIQEDTIKDSIDTQLEGAFNSKFLVYTGRQTGATTRQLISAIYGNNIINSEHIVTCILDGNVEHDISQLRTKISLSKYYQISFKYDSLGYVYRANIVTED